MTRPAMVAEGQLPDTPVPSGPAPSTESRPAETPSPKTPPARTTRGTSLTGRALVLGAVLVLLALVLASPLQRYLRQRDALAQARHQQISVSAQVAQLARLKAQWADPTYIEQQARARLQYARPGDTVYVVIGPHSAGGDAAANQATPATSTSGQSTWQTRAWTSLQVADAGR